MISNRPLLAAPELSRCESDGGSTGHRALRAYFRSGWAFLIPYLAAYLLYAWTKWPVNPASGGEEIVKGVGESGTVVGSQWSIVPPLLHVYWFLHGLHLILGAFALRAWWRKSGAPVTGATDDGNVTDHATPPLPSTVTHPGNGQPSTGRLPDTVYRLLPWICLMLLFYIPGVYLEWPSDPWEHLRRINEWRIIDIVTAHSSWLKSSYFIPYSLLSWATGLRQVFWLDFYYTGICLLLSWQYYRLARACGLGERASFVFVLLNAVTFGNNIFSFYRYYGLSSSILAQIGAVALTRVALEALRTSSKEQESCYPLSATRYSLLRLGAAALTLLPLIGFNHIQGLGIAGLSVGSVAAWRILHEKPSKIWWLVAALLVLSVATILWWPRHPLVDQVYRPEGWLTDWYGFNFAWPSPTTDRSLQILGALGVLNFLAALVLLRRNHIAGWLTAGPLLALFFPFVALPLANKLAAVSPQEILTFHRMLFAIPGGLALICCLREATTRAHPLSTPTIQSVGAFFALVTIVAGLVLLPPGRSAYNRFWHFIHTTPQDLQLKPVLQFAESTAARVCGTDDYTMVSTETVGFVFNTFHPAQFPLQGRNIRQPVVPSLSHAIAQIRSSGLLSSSDRVPLNSDPFAADPSAWVSMSGPTPEFITNIRHFPISSTALQNPSGQSSQVFTSAVIPVDPAKTYGLELSLQQPSGTQATAYLAVGWYNATGDLLVSNLAQPTGAGAPIGWVNGSFSYFGLIANLVPAKWTTYRKLFGPGTETAIPSNARSVRIGALLNYNVTLHAVIQMTNVRFWQESGSDHIADGTFPYSPHSYVVTPSPTMLFTPGSQAGQTTRHWPAQQLATQFGGSPELLATALSANAMPVIPAELHLKRGASQPP